MQNIFIKLTFHHYHSLDLSLEPFFVLMAHGCDELLPRRFIFFKLLHQMQVEEKK